MYVRFTAISAGALLIACVFDLFFSTKASGIVVLLSTLAFVVSDALHNPRVHLLFFYPNYYFVGMLVSCMIIYSGAYLTESRLYGYPNGAMGFFSLFYIFCLSSFKRGLNKKLKSHNVTIGRTFEPRLQSYVISAVAFLTALLVVAATVLYSTPVLMGINRVQYFKSVPLFVSYLKPAVFYFVFFAAYRCFILRWTLSGWVLLALAGFGIYFFLGEKFSGFILAIMAVSVVYAAGQEKVKISRTVLLSVFAAILGLAALIIFAYGGGEKGFDRFVARIALQAQVGWIFFNGPITWLAGLYRDIAIADMVEHIEYMFTPYDFYVRHYVQGGNTLTGFYPAAFILKYGMLVALLFSFIFCYLLGTLSNFVWTQLRKRQLFVSFLLYSAYMQFTLFLFAVYIPGIVGSFLICFAVSIWIIVLLNPKRTYRPFNVVSR